MSEELLPELRVATEALESRIAITDGEVAEMKETIAGKRKLLRSLRKALATINPKRATPKKRAAPKLQATQQATRAATPG
jgi:hypothetical protein